MGIKGDAGILLNYIYNKKVEDGSKQISSAELIEKSGWEQHRVYTAIDYLCGKRYVLILSSQLNKIKSVGIISEGIDLIEKEDEFKRHFGFEVGVPGVFKFNWGASEK